MILRLDFWSQVYMEGAQRTYIFRIRSDPLRLFDRSRGFFGFLFGSVRPNRSLVFRKETQNQPKLISIFNFRLLQTYFEKEAATFIPSVIHQAED